MTLTHAHTNGAAVASSLPWLAEHVRAIDPDRQHRFEGYLSEILGSLGMDLSELGTAETPRRFRGRTGAADHLFGRYRLLERKFS